MGVRKAVAFGRRHAWPVTAAATAAILGSICGVVVSVEAMIRGPFLAGYLGAAASGDLLVWAVMIVATLWLPRKTSATS
ncbi:MAG TPA: hypothetical protein VKT20_03050 [Candidatus Dormibacteraeota bacterium]|nr:hypothetical protein [Candidatus Dormibacteraeota bacterium]